MGVFGFIKGIFAKEQELVEDVAFDDIDEWFSRKYSSKQDFLKGQIGGIKARIAEQISSTKQNIENLRNAQLRNPNIPEKAKHFMEGNRETYIKRTEQLLEQLNIPGDIGLVNGFLANFDNNVEGFGKSTARAYAILKEFFEEEASRIAGNIGNIAKLVKEIRESVKNSKLKEMDKIKQDIAGLKNKISRKEILEKETMKKESYSGDLEKEKAKAGQNIAAMEKSKAYKDYHMLKHRLNQAKKESAEKESGIAHAFASLERPMKKYLRIIYSDKELLEKYMQSPVNALMQDFGLKIVAILENMKKAIVDNTIELKDRQRVKAIEEIRRLGKDYLGKFLSEYARVKKKENSILKEMQSLNVIDELRKAKEKLKITEAMLDKAKKDMEALDSELSKIDIGQLKKELSEKIRSAADMKVVIS